MSDENATREQLLGDLVELRRHVALLERSAGDREEHYRSVVEGSPN